MNRLKWIIVHAFAHADELIAAILAVMYGGRRLPGIADAVFKIAGPGDYNKSESWHWKNGAITFGVVEGGRFNDKRGDGSRCRGECTTTRVTDFLGIRGRPELRRLQEETLRHDQYSGAPDTCLASVIKAVTRRLAGSPLGTQHATQSMYNWTKTAVVAIIEFEKSPTGKCDGELSLVDIFDRLFSPEYISGGPVDERPNDRSLKRVRDKLALSDRHLTEVTELGFIVRAVQRKGIFRGDDVISWMDVVISAMVSDQEEFLAEKRRVLGLILRAKKGDAEAKGLVRPFITSYFLNGRVSRLKGVVIRSDNQLTQKVARNLGMKIVVVRKTNGHVQIFKDERLTGLSFDDAIAMLRYLELSPGVQTIVDSLEDDRTAKVAGLTVVPYCRLSDEGNSPTDGGKWYNFKSGSGGQILMNGSNSKPDAPVNSVSDDQLVWVMKCGFNPRLIRLWQRRHRTKGAETCIIRRFSERLSEYELKLRWSLDMGTSISKPDQTQTQSITDQIEGELFGHEKYEVGKNPPVISEELDRGPGPESRN